MTEIKAALENEKEMREVVEHKLGESNRKVAQLQDQLVECTRIPELESKLIQSKDETQRLTKVVEDLEVGKTTAQVLLCSSLSRTTVQLI